MADERRQARTEIRHLQSESVWLQKALFALRKAESARERLADVRDEEFTSYDLTIGEQRVPVESLEDALDERVKALIENVRTMRRNLV